MLVTNTYFSFTSFFTYFLSLNSREQDGDTALIIASKGGRSGLVKLLVESGANNEAKDKVSCVHASAKVVRFKKIAA